MRGYVVIKNIKSSLEDISITDDVPQKNADYALMVDVQLLEKRVKQVEAEEEDEDVTFIFEPTGRITLLNKNKILNESQFHPSHPLPEFSVRDGHIVEVGGIKAAGEATGLQD